METLKNRKFDTGTPSTWGKWYTGTKHKYTYPESGREGGYSATIEYPIREIGKNASWIQTVNIDKTKKYKLSGYIKTQNIIGDGACIEVDWKDANKKYLSTSIIMTRKTGSSAWTRYEGIVTPNPGASVATVVLMMSDCSGKAWFDDISFSDIVTVKKHKCINGTCVEDPEGEYDSLEACQSSIKWACINDRCVPVCQEYQGVKYDNLSECQNACGGYIPPGYKLVFEDDFNGGTLDSNKWRYVEGSYAIQDSNLILGVNNNGGEIRGIRSDGSPLYQFKYGYVEYRAKLADAGVNKGFSNQLWFVNVPGQSPYGEINITETATGPIDDGNNPYGINKINTTVHCPTQPAAISRPINTGINLSKDYHIYAAEWTSEYVRFLLDGKEVWKMTPSGNICVPQIYMYLIAGLCKRPNTSDMSQCWPCTQQGNGSAKLYIDYIRVYQKV